MRAVLIVAFLLAALVLPQMWSPRTIAPIPEPVPPRPEASIAPVAASSDAEGAGLPRRLASDDARAFIERHASAPPLAGYLREPDRTPWGVVVADAGRDFLVFLDARARMHVVDVTAEPIVPEVGKAAYQSPPFDVVGLP